MSQRLWRIAFILLSIFHTVHGEQYAPTYVPVISCKLGATQVKLLAITTIDGKQLFLQFDGLISPAFSDMPNDDFIGNIVMSKCVDGVLIFALNYGPPYQKGVAIRWSKKDKTYERINFSEKALPQWLYVNREKMLIIIPNLNAEARAKYLVHDRSDGESFEVNQLPNPQNFRVHRLP